MIKLAIGAAIGFVLGAKLGEAGLEDLLQIAQQTLASEQVGDLIRAGAAALGDAVRTLGVALTEEAPAVLAERSARRMGELAA
jgi:hypothetical protein